MLDTVGSFGIIADNSGRRVSIFDIEELEAIQHIPLRADVIDVALASDCSRAVVSSFNSKTMFQIDLCGKYAQVIGSATTDTFLEDVALTPGDRYALSVDGSAANQDIVSYALRENEFISTIPASAQAVAVSPRGNGLVLTAVSAADVVHRYTIDRGGGITDTGMVFPAGDSPNNVNFSRDGRFAFVSNFSGGVSVLSTILPDKISLISSASGPASQSMAISRDGRHLFVLGPSTVGIYVFDPVAGSIELERSFIHGLSISSFFGVDQIALDPSGTRLFISASGQVAVFTTYGVRLGTVAGVSGPGGIAICMRGQ